MTARLVTALEHASRACRDEAARIRAALPEGDGAIDAGPRRTPDGLWESDAAEWDEDARQIEALLGARVAEERTTP